jgi:ABC-type amino acid transport substrate-binding protein
VRRVLLLAAAVALLAAALAVTGVGSAVIRLIATPTMLDAIRADGALRVAIRPDTPQVTAGSLAGFDVDVAQAIADRLGVALEAVVLPAAAMQQGGDWVLAMPSRAVTGDGVIRTSAYYRWPVLVLARLDASPGTLGELASTGVCVAEGTAAEAWARGAAVADGLDTVRMPPAWTVLVAADERTCLDELRAGRVDAAITARTLPGDLATTADLEVVGGPVAFEPAPVIVADSRGAGDLKAAVEAALDEMRRDGTLAALSRKWFGGEDLTAR